MTGQYNIELYNNRVHYFLTIERNITIIQGNSGTGKTELIRLLTLYLNNGISSGITLLCDKPCVVLDNAHWQTVIRESRQSIIFADEGSSFLNTREFAQLIRGSDNYFVLITRESLPQLPYSIQEIYGMRLDDDIKYHNAKRIYNELYHFYHFDQKEFYRNSLEADGQKADDPLMAGEDSIGFVLTEDSNSGYEFYQNVSEVPVRSMNGKSNVVRELDRNQGQNILVIVDGAAFGAEIGQLISYLQSTGRRVDVYAPESFEYLLLKADIIDHTSRITHDTWQYADSQTYMSWEEFFTAYLQQESAHTIYQYSKKKLNPHYLTAGNRKKVFQLLPESVVKDLMEKG